MLPLYKNIRKLREKKGISQQELADITEYNSRSSIAKIESGEVDLPQSKIELFAKALDTTPSLLMEWDEQPQPKNIFTKFKTMTHTVPVYGRIPAGLPFEAIQDCLGDVAVPDKIARKHDLFGLKIVGDSMNKKIPNGAIGVFQKCCEVNQGVIAAIMVNGDDATVKHFTKTFNGCLLEPDSYDVTYKERFIGEDEEDVRIIGKLVWFCMDPSDIK